MKQERGQVPGDAREAPALAEHGEEHAEEERRPGEVRGRVEERGLLAPQPLLRQDPLLLRASDARVKKLSREERKRKEKEK